MSIDKKLSALSDAQLGKRFRVFLESLATAKAVRQEEPEDSTDEDEDEVENKPTSKKTNKVVSAPTPAKKKNKNPMNEDFVGQQIYCLDKQWGTVVGMDEERRMWKIRATEGRGRPRLVPEALVEMATFKMKGGDKAKHLIERSLEHKMAA